jgi:hypothetical protein
MLNSLTTVYFQILLVMATALFPGEQHRPQPEEHGHGHERRAG